MTLLHDDGVFDSTMKMAYGLRRYKHTSLTDPSFGECDTFEGVASTPASLHKYNYASSDPINQVDPSGNFSVSDLLSSTGIQSTLQGLRACGIAGAKAYAYKTIQNVAFGAALGAAFGAAIEATDPDGNWVDGFIRGAEWGAIFGLVPAPVWRTPIGGAILGYFALDAAMHGLRSGLSGNWAQALVYFAGAGLTANGAAPGRAPRELYHYVPKNMGRNIGGGRNVSGAAIAAEGLKPGVDGSVYATTMPPENFSATRIGGEKGYDFIDSFPFLRSFRKNFSEGYVVRIKNTGRFRPADTYWKRLLGQWESSEPIPASDITVEPMSK